MSEIWLLRHATPLVAPGTCYGVTDMPANQEDTDAAARAFWLAWEAEHQALPAFLLCSPLQRCVQLGEALQRIKPHVALHLDANLREMNFGCWEGIAWADVPRSAIDEWTQHFATHAFGGVESVNDLIGRVGQVWDACVAVSKPDGQAPSVWVTHAGVIKAASWWAQSGGQMIARANQWPLDPCPFGSWRKLSAAERSCP
jgi:alpha-ribazole phosphatase